MVDVVHKQSIQQLNNERWTTIRTLQTLDAETGFLMRIESDLISGAPSYWQECELHKPTVARVALFPQIVATPSCAKKHALKKLH
jgi:hypothetical protein